MRKILVSIVLLLFIIACSVFTIRLTQDYPYGGQQAEVETPPPVDAYTASMKNEQFIKGYDDAQQGIIMGTIKWIFSKEYRQGHMLGTHDKNKNIKRYTKN